MSGSLVRREGEEGGRERKGGGGGGREGKDWSEGNMSSNSFYRVTSVNITTNILYTCGCVD